MSEPEFLTDPCPIELESVWGMPRNSVDAETVQPSPTPAPGSLASLRKAIQNRQLELSFQPIVHLDSGRPAGLEGRLTWVDPEWGGRQASSFGPLADRQGLAPRLIRAQFEQACRLVETLGRLPVEKRPIFVTLKVPTRHLADRSVIDDIVEVLGGTAVDPSRLVVEMTDLTSMAGRYGVRPAVVTLREAGIRVALAQFGTQASSIRDLRELPFTDVKIDGALIRTIKESREDRAVVSSLVQLAHILGLTCTGEGVEGSDQASSLLELGCDLGQGAHWGSGVPEAAVQGVLQNLQQSIDRVGHRAAEDIGAHRDVACS